MQAKSDALGLGSSQATFNPFHDEAKTPLRCNFLSCILFGANGYITTIYTETGTGPF